MRTGVIVTRKHGSEKFELKFGPETAFDEQRQFMRSLLAANCVSETISEAQQWTSDQGLYRSIKCRKQKDVAAEAAETARQQKLHEDSVTKIAAAAKAPKAPEMIAPAKPISTPKTDRPTL